LPPAIPGDLDCIVHKALAREPEARYASAAGLDDDLRRFEQGLPVAARGNSRVYRAGMFARRHNIAVAASLIVLIAVSIGIVAVERESRIGQAERLRAEMQAVAARQAQSRAEGSEYEALKQRTEALIQKADAERRLQSLQSLAEGAARAYQESERPGADPSTIIATLTRDTLLTLRQETPQGTPPVQREQLDRATAKIRSGELATPSDWTLPEGWNAEGDHRFYRVGLDDQIRYNGRHSLFLNSVKAGGDTSAMIFQSFSARDYVGKRVRLSAMIRTQGTEYATLGIRTYSGGDEFLPSYRLIKGTRSWTSQEVVLDIPRDAQLVEIVLMQFGIGTTWANGFDFRVVNRSIPLSDSLTDSKAPSNLDFSR
jgi:hypothetical protein